MDELKEERRLEEFVGSQGTRKRGLKVMHGRPCICANYAKYYDLKKSMACHAYCAWPCIEDRKFPAKMHDHAFQPSTHAQPVVHLPRLCELI